MEATDAAGADAVLALHTRARTATFAGAAARALELNTRAVAAAPAAFGADSLVVAYLHLELMENHLSRAECAAGRDAALECTRDAWAAQRAAHAILAPRHAAGTLLPGRCRQEELAFKRHISLHTTRALQPQHLALPGFDASLDAAAHAVGYAAFLKCAYLPLIRLCATSVKLPFPPFAPGEQAPAQALVLDALDLLAGSERYAFLLSEEQKFATVVLCASDRLDDAAFRDAARAKLLACGAMLRQRGVIAPGSVVAQDARLAARHAAVVEKRGLHTCELTSCARRETTVNEFKTCGACKSVWYCCVEHSKLNWKAHKQECRRIAAESA
jgi:hypothetical protein